MNTGLDVGHVPAQDMNLFGTRGAPTRCWNARGVPARRSTFNGGVGLSYVRKSVNVSAVICETRLV